MWVQKSGFVVVAKEKFPVAPSEFSLVLSCYIVELKVIFHVVWALLLDLPNEIFVIFSKGAYFGISGKHFMLSADPQG